jgi:hypothetical protein
MDDILSVNTAVEAREGRFWLILSTPTTPDGTAK